MERSYDHRVVEARWGTAWRHARCFEAPDRPERPKFFNYDSGPFPNGPLHIGHVRCYSLGDVVARYKRLAGFDVLYATEWDSFGLPIELAAIRERRRPADAVAHRIGTIRRQLERLGISYDFRRIKDTSDPAYYRWTQSLFLDLLEDGLVHRSVARLPWCPGCRTVLSAMQVEEDRCWRCETPVEQRETPQWFVATSRLLPQLAERIDTLVEWSERARRLLRRFDGDATPGSRGGDGGDWLVSRQRSWGTPIPIVHCAHCGTVPVPREALPVRLPAELDPGMPGGALDEREDFFHTDCPRCGREARRETDTLDCFFDDIWCQWSAIHPLEGDDDFFARGFDAWMPVDQFHSGLDTFAYLNLHRALGEFLHRRDRLAWPEPIRSHHGHEMVLSRGRKMSKHLGNAVSVRALLAQAGGDALRVAILRAARPERSITWEDSHVERAVGLLERLSREGFRVAGTPDTAGDDGPASRAARHLRTQVAHTASDVARFIDEYRPNAAIDRVDALAGRLAHFGEGRVGTGRMTAADMEALRSAWLDTARILSPFAPFLAEELWSRLGGVGLVAADRWPHPTEVQRGTGQSSRSPSPRRARQLPQPALSIDSPPETA